MPIAKSSVIIAETKQAMVNSWNITSGELTFASGNAFTDLYYSAQDIAEMPEGEQLQQQLSAFQRMLLRLSMLMILARLAILLR